MADDFVKKAFEDAVSMCDQEYACWVKDVADNSENILIACAITSGIGEIEKISEFVNTNGLGDTFSLFTSQLMMYCYHRGWISGGNRE